MKDKNISCSVEVDKVRQTITDPRTGKDWPIYFEEPEDFEVIDNLLAQLSKECEKRMIPCVASVVRSHRPNECGVVTVGIVPGPRALRKTHLLFSMAKDQEREASSTIFLDLLRNLIG